MLKSMNVKQQSESALMYIYLYFPTENRSELIVNFDVYVSPIMYF